VAEPAAPSRAQVATTRSAQHRAVDAMLVSARFDHIEDCIKATELPSERLRALCLLVWAEAADADTRRQMVAELSALLA
jgi:hypothetical protein